MRYFIELSYNGTPFHGWQVQSNAISVQEHIEKWLSTLLKVKIQLTGSSRTDTGVHAAQQFAHFDFSESLSEEILSQMVYRLNALLPKEIAVQTIYVVTPNAHARFDAIYRKYTYRIIQQKNPFWSEFAYYLHAELDINKMNEAGIILTQHIDYQSFSKVHTVVKTFECKIVYAFWERKNEQLLFHIKADRFLRGMVRTIVGTMIEIGANRLSLAEFEQIILSKNRSKAGRAVPAQGLTLMEVGYPK